MIPLNYKLTGIKEILSGNHLISNLQDLIQLREALVVCDQNTFRFLPAWIKGEKNFKLIVLPKNVRPYEALVRKLAIHVRNCELIVALGSGTITDICKYLANLTTKELVLFPSAPSVNAYTSPTASIISLEKTRKVSVKAKMPTCIYLDYTILKSVPPRMILSGLYDLLCSRTAKVDYFIASITLKHSYIGKIFEELLPYEEILLKHSKLLIRGDTTLVSILMHALNLSGLGMWLNGDSRSASQGEHMLAHLLEKASGKYFLHGEMVAAGMLATSLLQERFFKKEQKIEFNTQVLNKYVMLKGLYPSKIDSFAESFQKLRMLSPVLSSMVSEHTQLRRHIGSTAITLPKVHNLLREAVFLKRNFTCLDIAYLAGYHTITL
ncbi:AraM domain protein [Neorickettsia sennetsu str. Miyayama]|uniref:AraM domain protein n=1 Tax=Ehrlichia sennetsu (strain ATCC VR-367 / Miyayama) TaxID=222891 RepID=Q2GCJ2_EHRS3|nr:AraM domain protein [Neorickettsia sennetsu str. Miyayama]